MVDLVTLVNCHPTLGRRARGNSLAALRATTGAGLLASGRAATAEVAAACVGSTPVHVRAAAVLLKSEDKPLLDAVLCGEVALYRAAQQARRVSKLVDAYRRASRDDLITATRILDGMIVPDAAFGIAAE